MQRLPAGQRSGFIHLLTESRCGRVDNDELSRHLNLDGGVHNARLRVFQIVVVEQLRGILKGFGPIPAFAKRPQRLLEGLRGRESPRGSWSR